MKTKENIKNGIKNNKKNMVNNIFYKLSPMGISLIVLVITIIVIIILATAIIVAVLNNNPISEANKARFQNDRDNMQSIFTNTVAKVMAVNQGSIKINPGKINEVESGVNSTTGEVEYTLNDSINIESISGKIIFDSKENTKTDYYTGKQLPIYKSGKTQWTVNEEGVLNLKIGDKIYGEGNLSTGDGGSDTGNNNGGSSGISNEEYTKLLERINEIEKNQEALKVTVDSKTESSDIRTGSCILGGVNGYSAKIVEVKFEKPMKDNNYSVSIDFSSTPNSWAYVQFAAVEKTSSGFKIYAYNTCATLTGSINVDYIVIHN